MILKNERPVPEIHKGTSKIETSFKGIESKKQNQFYKYDESLSRAIAGYQQGPKNPYVEKLMQI